MSDHAIVPVGEYLVPLIGIPVDAAKERCDRCHGVFNLWEVWVGKQFLCETCHRYDRPPSQTDSPEGSAPTL